MYERRREEEGGTEAACASTRDLPHSRLPPHFSSPPFSFLSPCIVFFFNILFKLPFFFFFFPAPSCSLLCHPCVLSVPPPFVPALHAEDDTSNFEEPEQAAPWPASANQRGAVPAGFQGQDLPFLGWFFSRALTALAKSE